MMIDIATAITTRTTRKPKAKTKITFNNNNNKSSTFKTLATTTIILKIIDKKRQTKHNSPYSPPAHAIYRHTHTPKP